MTPDVYARVRFRTKEEGGRNSSVMGDFYACPMLVDGKAYDCRLLIKGMKLELGVVYEVPIKFLNRDLILPKLAVGKDFTLWEGKNVAEVKITKITNAS